MIFFPLQDLRSFRRSVLVAALVVKKAVTQMTPEAVNTAQAIGVDDIINEQRVLNTTRRSQRNQRELQRRELQVLGILDEDE